MKLENDRFPQGRVLRIIGDIDISCAEELRTPLSESLADGLVVIDMSQLKFIDSFGLGLLISFAKNPAHKGLLRFAKIPESIMRTIRMSRLDRIFTIFEDINAAVKAPIPRRIVIVDPDETTRQTIEAVLDAYDYNASAAADFSLLGRGRPDLIIAAAEVISNLPEYVKGRFPLNDKGRPATPPVLIITPSGKTQIASPLEAYIAKPFDPYDLLGITRMLLGETPGNGAELMICVKDQPVAEDIKYILEKHGYRVSTSVIFNAAMAELAKRDFRGLILGFPPPGPPVEKAIETIRGTTAGYAAPFPIILAGNPSSQAELLSLIKLGISDLVGVPISPEILLGKIAKHVP